MITPAAPLPSYDMIQDLPRLLEATVTPDFIDANGHMNIRHYLDHGAESADLLCREVGIDDDYRAQQRMGVFTAEHHLRYFAELHEGEKFSVHTRVLDRSDKVGHLIAFLLDRSNERLAGTVEIVLVHVGMDTRRPIPFPSYVAAGWDRLIAESSELAWRAPTCGAMGVRRQ